MIRTFVTILICCGLAASACGKKANRPPKSKGRPPGAMLSPEAMARPARPRPTPPARRREPPRPALTDALQVPTATGVTPLTMAQGATLPVIKVPVAEVFAYAKAHCRTHWYGLYLMGRKLGWATMGCRVGKQGDQPVVIRESTMVMAAQMYAATVKMTVKTTASYATTGRGELLRYEYEQSGMQQQQRLLITRKAKGWQVRREYQAGAAAAAPAGKPARAATVKPPEVTTLAELKGDLTNGEAAMAARLQAGKLAPGTRFRLYDLDPQEATDMITAAQVLGREKRSLRGVPVELYKIELLHLRRRIRGLTIVDGSANWLDGKVQGTIRIRREEKATAKRLEGGTGDFGLGVVIPTLKQISRPGKVRRLELKLTGFLPASIKESGRHKLEGKGPKSARLIITRESIRKLPKVSLPVSAKRFGETLKATHRLEIAHPEIKALAQKAIGDETRALAAAKKLTRFVFKYLNKRLATNLDSALAIARAKSGDCTEHARLMVALARAVGLPAREVGGVTYVPTMGGFGYHAWVEVWVGRWITADPAWNELPVNATHVRMGLAEDLAWIGTLGALKISIGKLSRR